MTSIISEIEAYILPTHNSMYKKKPIYSVSKKIAVLLDNTFSKVEYVNGLKTTLYEHQKTAVRAMLDLEQKRSIRIFSTQYNTYVTMQYNVSVLSEPVGSGKTIDILALCCLSPKPKAIYDIIELDYPHDKINIPMIKRKFKRLLTPTIIFVGVSVLNQWESSIEKFTELKTLVVRDVHGLKNLLSLIESNGINQYNIILVKNGKITVPIELFDDIELEDKNKAANPFIYNIIANLREYIWSRVVIDDFDTIKLPCNAGIVASLFTWYISSTRKLANVREIKHKYSCASDYLANQDYGCNKILSNDYLFEILNVRNCSSFIEETTLLPIIKYHIVVFNNPNNNYISLLASMNDDTVNRITDMLNANAIGTAADAAGIRSTSVVDIFEKLLGNKFEQYRFSLAVLDFIDMESNREDDRKEVKSEDPTYGKKRLLNFEPINYKYPNINSLLKETKIEYTEERDINGIAIQRVKDNIKHGECPLCRLDLQDINEFIILKCCGLVMCSACGIRGQKVNDRFNKLTGNCSQCRQKITIKDMIYLSDEFDLDKVLADEFEDEEVKVNDIVDVHEENTKYTAIIKILHNKTIPNTKHVDMCLPNMMKGNLRLPESPIRKLLVFANYEETLLDVIKTLNKKNIKYWKLHGSAGEISSISETFNKCKEPCILIINSTKHCSGLNLQTATDLIFVHSIRDADIESQVAGRGHRLGRTNPLNIWYLNYDNEYFILKRRHNIRELSRDEINTMENVE
jgi:hypothetical protein